MPYLLHPDKVNAVNNVILKRRARKPVGPRPGDAVTPPASGNLIVRLMQKAYQTKREKLGRTY